MSAPTRADAAHVDPPWSRRIDAAVAALAPEEAGNARGAVMLAAFLVMSAFVYIFIAHAASDYGLDVSVYHAASREALLQRDAYASTYTHHVLPYAYPPTALLLLLPFALPLALSAALAYISSLIALVVAVRAILTPSRALSGPSLSRDARALFVSTVLLLTFPVMFTLHLGQINLVLAAVVLIDVLALGRTRWAGVLIGLAACIKLTPAVFIVWCWTTGRRRAARNAALTIAAVVLLSAWTMHRSFAGYLDHGAQRAVSRNAPATMLSNQSLTSLAARLGHAGTATGALVLVIDAAVLVIALIAATRLARRGEVPVAITMLGVVSVAVTPISWIHQFVWLPLLAVALWSTAASIRGSRLAALIVLVLAFVPPSIFATSLHGAVVAPLASTYFFVAAGLALWLMLARPRSAASVPAPAEV